MERPIDITDTLLRSYPPVIRRTGNTPSSTSSPDSPTLLRASRASSISQAGRTGSDGISRALKVGRQTIRAVRKKPPLL